MAFKEINPDVWSPEKDGDSITGILLRTEQDVGPNDSMMYHLESDGKPISVWGCTILDQRMQFVSAGSKIRITYKGLAEKKSGAKNPAKIFSVEVDDESNSIPEQTIVGM